MVANALTERSLFGRSCCLAALLPSSEQRHGGVCTKAPHDVITLVCDSTDGRTNVGLRNLCSRSRHVLDKLGVRV